MCHNATVNALLNILYSPQTVLSNSKWVCQKGGVFDYIAVLMCFLHSSMHGISREGRLATFLSRSDSFDVVRLQSLKLCSINIYYF